MTHICMLSTLVNDFVFALGTQRLCSARYMGIIVLKCVDMPSFADSSPLKKFYAVKKCMAQMGILLRESETFLDICSLGASVKKRDQVGS
eukprot:2154806-Pyramimonas_sp.AAC.1